MSAALLKLSVSRLPLLLPRRPTCSRNFPACVNFRIWFSVRSRRRGSAGRRDPDVALVVDVDAVLVLRPLVLRRLAAPALEVVAGGVELHHRRRRRAAGRLGILRLLVVVQRPRALDDPHVIARVDVEARRPGRESTASASSATSDRPETPAPTCAVPAPHARASARRPPTRSAAATTAAAFHFRFMPRLPRRGTVLLLHYTLGRGPTCAPDF